MKVKVRYVGERPKIVVFRIPLAKPRNERDRRTHYEHMEKFIQGRVQNIPVPFWEELQKDKNLVDLFVEVQGTTPKKTR